MEIKWTSLSKNDYWQNIEYLESYWTEKETQNFIDKVDFSLDLLSKGNISFFKSDYLGVYKMVIIKQVTLFYSIRNNTIFLLRFWNNHQDLTNFKLQ
jgi:hypothetical protein